MLLKIVRIFYVYYECNKYYIIFSHLIVAKIQAKYKRKAILHKNYALLKLLVNIRPVGW